MTTLTHKKTAVIAATAMAAGLSLQLHAADWSTTELQFQYGNLEKPFQGGGSDAETGGTPILTFQHASGWKYGDNFFFIDYLDYGRTDFEKDNGMESTTEFYGELYSNFSLSKMTGGEVGFGFVKDIGLLAGFNFAPEVDTMYFLPGVRLDLNLPGFAFAHLDTMAYLQTSDSNVDTGVKIEEDDAWIVDFNWAYPFTIGSSKWTIEGHVEYIDGADQKVKVRGVGEFDGERESWILAQPQLRVDIGDFWGAPGQIFAGIEYQYWKNKLGDKDTDESVIQALLVWRL